MVEKTQAKDVNNLLSEKEVRWTIDNYRLTGSKKIFQNLPGNRTFSERLLKY